MRKLILLFTALICLRLAFSLSGGTSNSYSADPSDFSQWDSFSRADGTALGSMLTGQAWTESAGDVAIRDGAFFMNTGGDAAYISQVLDQNFTCDIYENASSTGTNALGIYGCFDNDCSLGATEVTLRFGVLAGEVQYRTALDEWASLAPAVNVVLGDNYTYRLVFDVTNQQTNYTAYKTTNQSGTLVYAEQGSKAWEGWVEAGLQAIQIRAFGSVDIWVDEMRCFNWTNQDNALDFPTAAAPSDSCTAPASGAWAIDCSDNCAFDTDQDVPGDVHVSGSGDLMVNTRLTFTGSDQTFAIDSGCDIDIRSGGRIG